MTVLAHISEPHLADVSVVGLGRMGSRVAGRLLGAGYRVAVWNRSPEKTAPLAARGAHPAASPAAAAASAPIVITFVTDLEALREVAAGPDGIARGVSAQSTVIDMSTVGREGPGLLAALLPAGTALLDAPVLGSTEAASAGSLTIFVGGPATVLAQVRPLLSVLGEVVHLGPAGAGAAAKLVANAALLASVVSLGEVLALGTALGLTGDILYRVLAATPLAGQASRRRPVVESGGYPPRFALSLARKDADLIMAAAAAAGLPLPAATAVRDWLASAEQAGLGDRDYTSVLAAILAGSGSAPGSPAQGSAGGT